MKKFYLFTKTLLVATILLVGGANSAWGETVTKTYDFETYSKTLTANYTLVSSTSKPSTSLTVDGQTCYVFENITNAFWFDHRFAAQVGSDANGWMIQRNNSLYSSCGGSRKLAVLGLKKGDKISFNFVVGTDANAKVTFGTTNLSADGTNPVTSGNDITSGAEYTVLSDGNIAINAGRYYHFKTITIKTDEIYAAIWDTKQNETSAEYATYIDGKLAAGVLNSAEDVYAAHTAWQIAQADAASSNDVTKVIFDAAVYKVSYWNSARSNSNQQYTGAPDNTYFDAWDANASNASQTIYGLPAGSYTLAVATRASESLSDLNKYNVWVNGGTANEKVLGNHIGSSGGSLGNGWSWTIIPFTLDAKANLGIGFYSLPGSSSDLWAGCDDFHLYKGTLSEVASILSYEWATFSSDYALDFTGISDIEAYMITGHDGNVVTKAQVTGTVPAGTGLLLKGAAGSYNIPVVASSNTDVSANKLVAGTGASVSKEDNMTKYVLGVSAGNEAEFQKIDGTAATVDKGKAYLVFNGENLARTMSFEDEKITGVENVEAAPAEATLKDGKFIVDGKLVIFKKGMKFNANGQLVK